MATRNRVIYGSQSVWCNGAVLYRLQTLGSTTTFTSEDLFELGHLDIIDVVDDVPAVAITLNTNDWGDVKTMAVLAQVPPAKLDMDATALTDTANLVVVSGTQLTETAVFLHGACLADFAVVCGNLPGVSIWAPIQSECDIGTLANNVDQTMYMDEVFVNSLEFSYTTGANATENYGAETDQKMWLLNDGRFVNWETFEYATFSGGSVVLGTTPTVFSTGEYGFLRTDDDGYRGVTYYDSDEGTMTNYRVDDGLIAVTNYFVLNSGTDTLYLPTGLSIGSSDKLYTLYAANAYASGVSNVYFSALDDDYRAEGVGATRQGQVEVYIVSDTDVSFTNAWRLTGCTITSDLTREPLAELGHLGPYDRPLTVPIPITLTIDTTAGDLEHWAVFADKYAKFVDGTLDDISLSDLSASEDLKLVIKVFAQTDEEAGGTASNRKVQAGSVLDAGKYFEDGVVGTYDTVGGGTGSTYDRERALKTIVVEHIKITDEAYTLDMGTNATQTFGFRSTNDLYVVKGDLSISNITNTHKVRRHA